MNVKYLSALVGLLVAVVGFGVFAQMTGYVVSHDASQISVGATPLIDAATGKISSSLISGGGGAGGAISGISIPVTNNFTNILNAGESPVYIQPLTGKIKIYYYIPYYQIGYNGAPYVPANTLQRIVVGGKTGATINVTHGLYYITPASHPNLINATIVNLGNSSSARIIKLVTTNLVGYSISGTCSYGACDTNYAWLVEETMDNAAVDETNINNYEKYGSNPSAISLKLNVDCISGYQPFCALTGDSFGVTGITGIKVFSN